MKKLFVLILVALPVFAGCSGRAPIALNPRNPLISIPSRFLEVPLLVRVTNDLPYEVAVMTRRGEILLEPACGTTTTCADAVDIEAGKFQLVQGTYGLLVTVRVIAPAGVTTIERSFSYEKYVYYRREREMGLVVVQKRGGDFDLVESRRSYSW